MRYIVVDLEATCWDGSRVPGMEIIEIGAVELDDIHFFPMSDFDQFVRPTERPYLTEYCRELTTIDQSQIDRAPTFPEAFEAFNGWIGDRPFKLCSWGDFDFKLINAECERHKQQMPSNLLSHVNLKKLYSRAYGTKSSLGLKEAMRKLNIPFEGTMHRGIDDARNIAKIAQNIPVFKSHDI